MADKDDLLYDGKPFFEVDEVNDASPALSRTSLERAVELLNDTKEMDPEGEKLELRPYAYDPVSFDMLKAMRREGWVDDEDRPDGPSVAKFFSGEIGLPKAAGSDECWWYGPGVAMRQMIKLDNDG